MPRFSRSCQSFQFVLGGVSGNYLFVWRFGRSANVQVAQIPQHGFVFVRHPAREIRIAQMLIPRRLRHVLQYTQTLLNRTLPLRRQLLPLRHHIVLDVILLFRRHPVPVPRALLHLLPLSGIQLLIILVVLQRSLFFLRAQIVEIPTRRSISRRRTILFIPRALGRTICILRARTLRNRWPIRITLIPLAPPFLLALLTRRLSWFLSLFSPLLLPLLLLRFWRTILRFRRKRNRNSDSQRQQPNPELEFRLHSLLHLLRLLRRHIAVVVIRLRLRQIRQRRKTRNHVVICILHHRQVLLSDRRMLHRLRSQPNRCHQKQRSHKSNPRRRRQPRKPALAPLWLRRNQRMYPRIERARRLDHRQLVQQIAHRAKLIRTQTARRTAFEMLFHFGALVFLQAAIHIRQNSRFHFLTAHNYHPWALVLHRGRHQWGQLHSQRFVRPEEQRLQRALRAPQNLRNFRIVQLLILMQQNRRALLLRQLFNCMANHFFPRLFHQVLLDVRMLVCHFHRSLVAIFRVGHDRRVHGNLQLLVPMVAQRIQREIGCNPKEPGGELRAWLVIFPRAIHPQKNFLGQIFRLFPAPNNPVQEIDQRRPIALEQKLERLLVARLYVQHQLDV